MIFFSVKVGISFIFIIFSFISILLSLGSSKCSSSGFQFLVQSICSFCMISFFSCFIRIITLRFVISISFSFFSSSSIIFILSSFSISISCIYISFSFLGSFSISFSLFFCSFGFIF